MKKIIAIFYPHFSRQLQNCLLISALLLLNSITAVAQNKWSITLQPGANIPIQELAGVDLSAGFGIEASINYSVITNLSTYAGWGWNRFSSKNDVGEGKVDYEVTGYHLGLQFFHSINHSKIKYLVGTGALYNHIEVENSKGDIVADTKHGWGWEANIGIQVPIARKFSLTPNLRYRSLSRTITLQGPSLDADLRFLTVGLGINMFL